MLDNLSSNFDNP